MSSVNFDEGCRESSVKLREGTGLEGYEKIKAK